MNEKTGNEPITKQKVAISFIWNILEKFSSQGLQFIISIILARILLPDDYGVVALITVLIQVANVFVIDGFNTSLVQKKNPDELDFSSVFWFTCLIALCFYFIFYFSAPFIADFYKQPVLKTLTRFLALSFIYTPLSSCQYAYISKHLLFKVYFLRSIVCMTMSGAISIYLALKGAGVYALVIQSLSYGTINCIILWLSIEWRPKFLFSFSRIKLLISFGWKIVVSSLMTTLFKNVYSLIIGKVYSTEQLGLYNRGQQFPGIIANNFLLALKNVIMPTYSSKNNDIEVVKSMARNTVSVSAYVLLPLLCGLLAVARPLVKVLLTEKWLDTIPFLQISCAFFIFSSLNETNLTAINALGYSGIFLKYEIIKKSISIVFLVFSIPFGIYWMALGQFFASILSTIINMIPSKKVLHYTYTEQIKDLLPTFLLATVMGIIVYACNFLRFNDFMTIFLQIFVGVSFYISVSLIQKNKNLMFLLKLIRKNSK